MPQQLGAPGVYIEEIPSGRRVIRSVATSIGAFVDFFREGPVNEPVRIFGTGDFERTFGGYDTRSESSFQIPQFFLNGGTEAWVVRVTDDTALRSTIAIGDLTVTAANPGAWGDRIRAEVDYNTAAPNRFNLRVIRFASTDGNAQGLLSETFLDLSMTNTDPRFVETIVNDGSQMVTVTATGGGLPPASGTQGTDISALLQADFNTIGGGTTVDVTIGGATESVTFSWPNVAPDEAVTSLGQLRARVEAAIRAAAVGNPAFSGSRVFLERGAFRVISGQSGAGYDPADTVIFAADASATTMGLATGTATESATQFELGGGADGGLPQAGELIGSNALEPPTGMFALDNVDLFNILMIPRAAALTAANRDAVYSQAISYAEDRRAMVIIDLPEGITTLQDMTDLMTELETAGYRSTNSAIYYPRVVIPDPTNDFRLRAVGASGTMGGVWARTDSTRGVWKTPAGIDTTLEGVSQLEAVLNDGQNGVLNPLAINALRTFPVIGTVAWGGRTGDGTDVQGSEWQYISVRRTALMLQESLFRGTQWVVFEPNDEPLWANIRLNVGAFMNGLFQQGAFQGATPREAYYVKCDSETTTQNDIDAGIVNIEVGFAPLKPAEFVVIRFRQITGDVQT
ncbi:MAG: phage tail sheath C-terminal domain-containing protein [Pseudomonadota bacterium]